MTDFKDDPRQYLSESYIKKQEETEKAKPKYEVIIYNWQDIDKKKRERLLNYIERVGCDWELINRNPIKVRQPIQFKTAQLFGAMFAIVLLGILVYSFAEIGRLTYIEYDHREDIKACDAGMSTYNRSANCYANSDFWEINQGHGISCICFDNSEPKIYNFEVA